MCLSNPVLIFFLLQFCVPAKLSTKSWFCQTFRYPAHHVCLKACNSVQTPSSLARQMTWRRATSSLLRSVTPSTVSPSNFNNQLCSSYFFVRSVVFFLFGSVLLPWHSNFWVIKKLVGRGGKNYVCTCVYMHVCMGVDSFFLFFVMDVCVYASMLEDSSCFHAWGAMDVILFISIWYIVIQCLKTMMC